jgi:hypothetical protein
MEAIVRSDALVDVPPSLMRSDLERREPFGRRFTDLTGHRYEHCEVIGFAGFLKTYGTWLCRCDCGNLFLSRSNAITKQGYRCGCLLTTHGLSGTYWISTYNHMLSRCYNPKDSSFHIYGGRGIKVCKRWRDSITYFVADMGERPSEQHSIDRYPNGDGNYEPGNCRWATSQEQSWNSRKPRWVEHDGENLPLAEWARRIGVTRERMRTRVNCCILRGIPVQEAVTTPPGERMPSLVGNTRATFSKK